MCRHGERVATLRHPPVYMIDTECEVKASLFRTSRCLKTHNHGDTEAVAIARLLPLLTITHLPAPRTHELLACLLPFCSPLCCFLLPSEDATERIKMPKRGGELG